MKKSNRFEKKFHVREPFKEDTHKIIISPEEYKEIDTDSYIENNLEFNFKIKKINNVTYSMEGNINGNIYLQCSRCLELKKVPTDIELTHLFKYTEYPVTKNEDMNLSYYETSYIDVLPFFREELIFLMPIFFVCDKDCKGLCTKCGVNLNKEPNHTC